MADAKEYNGWSNWATWNLALWAGNDEDTYDTVRHTTQFGDAYTSESAEAVARDLYPSGTPDMDAGDMAYVNWQEIADAWNEE